MQPLSAFSVQARRDVGVVMCDIDDTLTTDGRLTAAAYGAMERLQQAGIRVVPVTGRPAGWCDHIARMWPVASVVGENGAFYFAYDHARRLMKRRYAEDGATRQRHRARLAEIGEAVVEAVSGCALAADQRYREADLAIDYCEDVPRLPQPAVDRIVALMQSHGLTTKVSSIHVNGWFGAYDKLTMAQQAMREVLALDPQADNTRCVFVGDSPNDAPMFRFFKHSVGVANVRDFAGRLADEPAYVTTASSGAGFVELADALLAVR